MARRDITGAVDFAYLEGYAGGDAGLVEEVLVLFREQAEIWRAMLEPASPGWRDAVHTLKGASRGIGAVDLGNACETAETQGEASLSQVHTALDAALFDVAAYLHEQALKSLRG
ncbi:Hpt domain-containing protein [soil metagenome]